MTPLAALLYRSGPIPTVIDDTTVLRSYQYFDCTALLPLVHEVSKNLTDSTPWDAGYRMPAEMTGFEISSYFDGIPARMLLLAKETGDHIGWSGFLRFNGDARRFGDDGRGRPYFLGAAGFIRGTMKSQWLPEKPETDGKSAYGEWMKPEFMRRGVDIGDVVKVFSLFVEQFSVIIGQPGLTEYVDRPTDKRVLRALPKESVPFLETWHELKIRSGVHTRYAKGTPEYESLIRHPLHYTRAHRRNLPTGKVTWVRGFWSGNADVGISLKTYSPQPPVRQGEPA